MGQDWLALFLKLGVENPRRSTAEREESGRSGSLAKHPDDAFGHALCCTPDC
jgi:hypothetical protein